MRKLVYMNLESYVSRYTYQLTDWSKRVFDKRKIDYVIVPGDNLDNSGAIVTGQVLDAHGRSYFSMSQMMNLVKMMRYGEITADDVIFFEDMFSPGIESLPYIINQVPENMRPKIYVRCLAQTIDPDDFVHVWNMSKWMSLYEQMCNEFVTGILATNEEMVAHMKIANWSAPIYNISGLSFGKDEVLERIGGQQNIKPFNTRPLRVSFAARFDQEKQPGFFMDIIEQVKAKNPEIIFSILSGGKLKSNNQQYINRARQLESNGMLEIHENLSKNQYYELLNNTRVLVNTALQDWVSNTVNEADTLGSNVLYPAYRSFSETFANDHERLYIPWSIDDAANKLYKLIDAPHNNMGKISNWNDKTIDRIVDIITGNGEKWKRDSNDYRQYIRQAKYI